MKYIALYAAAFLVTIIGAATTASAQATTQPAPAEQSGQPAETPKMFPRGMEYYRLQGGYQNQRNGEDEHLITAVFSRGGYFLDNAAAEIQFVGVNGHDDEESFGVGINALAKYHFINLGRFSLYGDVLAGAFWVSQDFPTGGTELNFTYAGGPGLSYKIRDGLFLDGGIRFQHVSNFFIEGRDRNPIFNSIGGYVGIMWTR